MAIVKEYRVETDPILIDFAELKTDILYKYRAINEFSLSILKDKQIFFSFPDAFNDPFDCAVPTRFDLLSDAEFRDHSILQIQGAGNVSLQTAIEQFERVALRNPEILRPEYRVKMMNDQLADLRRIITVYCLTTKPDVVVMWSHYAQNHKGICIGFDINHLHYNTGANFGPVRYFQGQPKFKPEMDDRPFHIFQGLTKNAGWVYEDEYRFIGFDAKQKHDIDPKAIKHVVFGCQIEEAEKGMLIELIGSDETLGHVKLFQAKKQEFSFYLVLEPLN